MNNTANSPAVRDPRRDDRAAVLRPRLSTASHNFSAPCLSKDAAATRGIHNARRRTCPIQAARREISPPSPASAPGRQETHRVGQCGRFATRFATSLRSFREMRQRPRMRAVSRRLALQSGRLRLDPTSDARPCARLGLMGAPRGRAGGGKG